MEKQENLPELLAWLGLALLGSVLAGGFWFVTWRRLPWLPRQRTRATPWTGWDVFTVFVWVYIVLNSVIFRIVPPNGEPKPELLLWQIILFPIELGFIPLFLRLSSGARPYQMGLTTHRLGANLALGFLAWFFLSMPVLFLNYLVSGLQALWKEQRPDVHPLFEMFDKGTPDFSLWVLIACSALLVAPLREELLFRGVLQPWLERKRRRAYPVLLFAFLLAVTFGWSRIKGELPSVRDPEWWPALLDRIAPALFVAVMILGYFVSGRLLRHILPDAKAAGPVYASSLLFAASHSSVWPSPVALFLLGIGLGFLAYRTRSLVGPITAHALFNSIGCLAMLLQFFIPTNGKAPTTAETRPVAVSTASSVPGSLLPRRMYASAIPVPNRGDTTAEVTRPTSVASR
jgi:membrane protease YdiL (CAAX protease family)